MKKIAAVILDEGLLAKWQNNALLKAKEYIDVRVILSCKNTRSKKNIFKHFLYYLINFHSLRNSQTKKIKPIFSNTRVIEFNSNYSGSWQSLPDEIIKELKQNKVEIIIKFGMGLLNVDKSLKKFPIFSFHHGNPSKYRGRPAGFYEILNGEGKLGVVVQKLSNDLDAGKVYAFLESKVVNYSYKKTALNFYSNSEFLLKKAIQNYNCNEEIELAKDGYNFTLPSNILVIKFLFLLLSNSFRKIVYGLFFEKKWKVALIKNKYSFESNINLPVREFKEIPIANGYTFYADPFFSHDGKKIRLEALRKKNGLGEILEISLSNLNEQKIILSSGNHYSYPTSAYINNAEFLLPETSSHSSQHLYEIKTNLVKSLPIKGLEGKKVVDLTLLKHDDYWFIFFSFAETAHTLLNLWISDSLNQVFRPHPISPIAINPSCARMGGNIINYDDHLFRLGQNNERGYGESLSIIKINKLTPTEYNEEHVGKISINGLKGPHTLNLNKDKSYIIFDYYKDQFSILAGYRRLLAKLRSK